MKKLYLMMAVLVTLSFSGCFKEEPLPQTLSIENAQQVQVSYETDGESWETSLSKEEIAQTCQWPSSLSLKRQTFKNGEGPCQTGGSSHTFTANNGERSFSYINYGAEAYIFHQGQWHLASTPADPPVAAPEEPAAQEISPAVMVHGALYYSTGKESDIRPTCGTMDGIITSQVAPSQYPTQDNQSNFGADLGYQIGPYSGQIMVYIDGKAIVFQRGPIPLEEIVALSRKDNLSWEDFQQYPCQDVGSGLYILHYQAEDGFYIHIGGPSPEEVPWYIRLIAPDDMENYIELPADNAEEFIKNNPKRLCSLPRR